MTKLEKALSDTIKGVKPKKDQGYTGTLTEWQLELIEEALKLMKENASSMGKVYLIDKTLKTLDNF